MLANSKPLSLFKEGSPNRISIAALVRHLKVLLPAARIFNWKILVNFFKIHYMWNTVIALLRGSEKSHQ